MTDIDRSDWFTRDVGEISHMVQDKLGSINIDISNHFFKCLTKYKIESGLKQHLEYRIAYHCKITQEHDYAKHSVYYDETILTPRYKGNTRDICHSKLGPCQPESNDFPGRMPAKQTGLYFPPLSLKTCSVYFLKVTMKSYQ